MNADSYDAKEVASLLKTTVQTVYRKAKAGDLPSIGKRPNIKFPKEAIDVIVELQDKQEEDNGKLSFIPSTLADTWTKHEMNRPYADEDLVPFKTIVAWRRKNNDITMNVKQGEKILGWVTFIPLDEYVIEGLINNEIREKDIDPQNIRKWSDKGLTVYIPTIEVISTGNEKEDRKVGMFLIRHTLKWAIMLMIQHDIKKWYGIGVTKEGQRMLEALGFNLIAEHEDGERKSYTLEANGPQVKLVTRMLNQIEALPLSLQKTTKKN